jgi:hypothetical protein
MIKIAITDEAFAAVEATLPLGTVGVEPRPNAGNLARRWGAQPAAPHARPGREL